MCNILRVSHWPVSNSINMFHPTRLAKAVQNLYSYMITTDTAALTLQMAISTNSARNVLMVKKGIQAVQLMVVREHCLIPTIQATKQQTWLIKVMTMPLESMATFFLSVIYR